MRTLELLSCHAGLSWKHAANQTLQVRQKRRVDPGLHPGQLLLQFWMRLNFRFFSLMAAYMRTGAFTRPKLMLPLHTARGFAGAMLTYTIGEKPVR